MTMGDRTKSKNHKNDKFSGKNFFVYDHDFFVMNGEKLGKLVKNGSVYEFLGIKAPRYTVPHAVHCSLW